MFNKQAILAALLVASLVLPGCGKKETTYRKEVYETRNGKKRHHVKKSKKVKKDKTDKKMNRRHDRMSK